MSKSLIDSNIRKAKKQFLKEFLDKEGFYYCQECNRSGVTLTCMHVVSVSDCQKKKEIPLELAWDISNLRLACIPCHQKYDKLDVR